MTLLTVNKDIQKPRRLKVKPFFPPPSISLATSWKITIHDARQEPLLWEEHKKAADKSFLQKGLSAVGEKRKVDTSRFPTFFAEARIKSPRGGYQLIGGIRMQLSDKDGKLSIVNELDGYADTRILSGFLKQFAPKNVAYGSGLWLDKKHHLPGLSADLARTYCLLVHLSKAQWHIGCTPHYILDAWSALGWSPVSVIPGFPYPDERYKSFVLFGNKNTWPESLTNWAEEQTANLDIDSLYLGRRINPLRVERQTQSQY